MNLSKDIEAKFKKLGINSYIELALLIPHSYEDLRLHEELFPQKAQLIDATVETVSRTPNSIQITFFAHNFGYRVQGVLFRPKPYMLHQFKAGQRDYYYGLIDCKQGQCAMSMPKKVTNIGKITPKYKTALRTDVMLRLIEKVLTKGRIDIIVSMMIRSSNENIELPKKVNIIIENKVDSSEHSNQTKKYYDDYTKDYKYKNDLNLFVFLLPVATSKLSDNLAKCEHFININYQLLADNIFERALNHDISDRVKFIITEYLLSLRKPSKKGTIMAIGKLEEELLKDFWEEHQELLMQMFPIIADLEEDQEKATILREVADKMNKNFKRYENLDEYIDAKLVRTDKDNIERLKLLMNKIESFFGAKIKITYAPSNINISNPKSTKNGKIFLYISTLKNKIRLLVMIPKINIELLNEDEIKNEKDNYMNILNDAFESLEN